MKIDRRQLGALVEGNLLSAIKGEIVEKGDLRQHLHQPLSRLTRFFHHPREISGKPLAQEGAKIV